MKRSCRSAHQCWKHRYCAAFRASPPAMKQARIVAIVNMMLFAIAQAESNCAANEGSELAPALVQAKIKTHMGGEVVETVDSDLGENSSTAACGDTDGGARNSWGAGCGYYTGFADYSERVRRCGQYNTATFNAKTMCCACGGGTGVSCSSYTSLPQCTQNGCAWNFQTCMRACKTNADCRSGRPVCDLNVCKGNPCHMFSGPNRASDCSYRNQVCTQTANYGCAPKPTCQHGTSATGRCGPQFGGRCRNPGEYCNEGNGWCGTTYSYHAAQLSDIYDYAPLSCIVVGGSAYTLLGKGHCMDASGKRVDHCYDATMFVTSQEQCQDICDAMPTCKAYEYGRENYYNCAVYPEGGDSTGAHGQMTCFMAASKSPVVKAIDFGHNGHCYKK